MANFPRSTLSETNRKLCEVMFSILNYYDNSRWAESNQVIYSTVPNWSTAYEALLVYTKTSNVKFPFASLTRNSKQVTTKLWSESFLANRIPTATDEKAKIVNIKPVRIEYTFVIYENKLEDIEALADIFIFDGEYTQRLEYNSEVLQELTRMSFIFGEPEHIMIPDRDEKRSDKGFIYGLKIPITVDCVLGMLGSSGFIAKAILSVSTNLSLINNTSTETEIIK